MDLKKILQSEIFRTAAEILVILLAEFVLVLMMPRMQDIDIYIVQGIYFFLMICYYLYRREEQKKRIEYEQFLEDRKKQTSEIELTKL